MIENWYLALVHKLFGQAGFENIYPQSTIDKNQSILKTIQRKEQKGRKPLLPLIKNMKMHPPTN